ncbi:MAG TPA: HAMP domain-containing protein, partial [Phycisphaerales bacterium]|nr:HAMP domain-containing protein [Phycisphaerales bacterium]
MTASLAICLLPAVAITVYSWAGLNLLLEAARQEERVDQVAAVCADQQKAALECRRYEKDILLSGTDTRARAEYLAKWRAQVSLLSDGLTTLAQGFDDAMSHDQQGRELVEAIAPDLESYRAGLERLIAENEAAGVSDPAALNAALTPHKSRVHRVAASLDSVQARVRRQIEASEEKLHGGLEQLAARVLVGLAAAAALGCASVVLLPRLLTRRVRKLGEFADTVRAGDLSVRSVVGGEDEVGRLSRALNQML